MTAHAGRTYLLTGGSRGLGFATAQVLAEEGADVVVSARDADGLSNAVRHLGARATGLRGDLGDPSFGAHARGAGPFDGALISVGGPKPGRALALDDADWNSAFDTVFLGTVRLVRALVDGGLRPGGAIALVLSTSVRTRLTGLSASNALRPALGMLVSDIAEEIAPRGYRIVGLLPGRFDTDRVRAIDAATGDAVAARAASEARIPLGRYGHPREFGEVAAFVLGPKASYVTGTCITVDGGLTPLP